MGLRGQRQRRERIPSLDTTSVAVSAPRTSCDASSPQAGIFLQQLQGFKRPLVAFLVHKLPGGSQATADSREVELFKSPALRQQGDIFSKLVELNCLMIDNNLNIKVPA